MVLAPMLLGKAPALCVKHSRAGHVAPCGDPWKAALSRGKLCSIMSTAILNGLWHRNRFQDFGRSWHRRLMTLSSAGGRGSDPRPLGPTMGGRLDRTCGERPRASKLRTCPKVRPTEQSLPRRETARMYGRGSGSLAGLFGAIAVMFRETRAY